MPRSGFVQSAVWGAGPDHCGRGTSAL